MEGLLVPWVIASTILLFVSVYWIYTLEKRIAVFQTRYEELLKIPEALEKGLDQAALLPVVRRLDQHAERLQFAESAIGSIRRVLPHTVQGIAAIRYSAFEGVGGDQSFSIALVDVEGHGAVMTGLHTGEDVRLYAKPLENWKSSHSLSEYEQEALALARKRMESG